MFAKQLTVFIENRTGRLCEVLNVLKNNNVNIISLSLADTTEFGLLRLIVDNPQLGKEKLTENGFSSLLSDISIIMIPHKAGSLQEILSKITEANVNIEYMYGLSVESEDASVVMKTNELATACDVLNKISVNTMTSEEMRSL